MHGARPYLQAWNLTFVDFSDPEDMFDLLIDYVTDARSEAADSRRREFLSTLLASLEELGDDFAGMLPPSGSLPCASCTARSRPSPRTTRWSQHLEDCAAELERLGGQGS